jgi:hypothetical protein
MTICIILVELMKQLPVDLDPLTKQELLMQRHQIAQDCLHRTVQLLQEYPQH